MAYFGYKVQRFSVLSFPFQCSWLGSLAPLTDMVLETLTMLGSQYRAFVSNAAAYPGYGGASGGYGAPQPSYPAAYLQQPLPGGAGLDASGHPLPGHHAYQVSTSPIIFLMGASRITETAAVLRKLISMRNHLCLSCISEVQLRLSMLLKMRSFQFWEWFLLPRSWPEI